MSPFVSTNPGVAPASRGEVSGALGPKERVVTADAQPRVASRKAKKRRRMPVSNAYCMNAVGVSAGGQASAKSALLSYSRVLRLG